MLIQFHMLQNYAPSNLNRDDTGSPKDAIFGSVPRGRISSQCLKRSMRKSAIFQETFKADGLIGWRTQRMPIEIGKELEAMGASAKEIESIVSRLTQFGRADTVPSDGGEDTPPETPKRQTKKPEKEKVPETKQLIFLSPSELRPFATKILEFYRQHQPDEWAKLNTEKIEKAVGPSVPRSVDIAMFGRMTTSQAFKNVDASVQVAHALSANAVRHEFDYYTAMDDLKPDSEPGADMIGDIEFNSNTYYKYFNVHWEKLVKNLGGDKNVAQRAVQALLEAAVFAQPSGKQNGFAAFNLPDFILVEVADRNLPVSYANAFLKPVRGGNDQSLLANSIEALAGYVTRLSRAYNLTPHRAYLTVDDCPFLDLKAQASLNDLRNWLGQEIPKA